MQVGINLNGPEWEITGAVDVLGMNYSYPTHDQIDYFASKGFTQIRLPTLWERLQPSLNGDLNPAILGMIKDIVAHAASRGMTVNLDIHNYGAFQGNLIGSSSVPVSAFANLWGKIAHELAGMDNVVFGLMNEPQQATAAAWLVAANEAIAAIRDAGATQTILVPGVHWTGGHSWTTSDNGAVFGAAGAVKDPLNNYAIEIHQYLDDTSGRYEWVVSETIGVERLTAVTDWARAHGVSLYLGEFGVANNARSLTALKNTMDFLQANDDVWTGVDYFAAGTGSLAYIHTVEPKLGMIDAAQMAVLDHYTGARQVETALGDGTIRVDTFVPGVAHATITDIVDTRHVLLSRTLFDASGAAERKLVVGANGTFTKTDYQPQSGAKLDQTYDSLFRLVDQTVWQTDGSRSRNTYDAATGKTIAIESRDAHGLLKSSTQFNADHIIDTKYDHGVILNVYTYTPTWQLEHRDTFDANGALTTRLVQHGANGSTLENYNPATGLITSKGDYRADWSTQAWSTYNSLGQIQTTWRYETDGSRSTVRYNSDGSAMALTEEFSSAGVLLSKTTNLGGSGFAKQTYSDVRAGQIKVDEKFATDMSLISRTKYDQSGLIVSRQSHSADGGYSVEVFTAADRSTPEVIRIYDRAGHQIGETRPGDVSSSHDNKTATVIFADNTTLAVARMFDAALDRVPGETPVQDWVAKLKGNTPLHDMATALMATDEFQQRYNGLSNVDYVEQLYRLVLDREGEAAGVATWSNLLASGVSRSALLVAFAESPEHVALTSASWGGFARTSDGRQHQAEAAFIFTDPTAASAARMFDTAFDGLPAGSDLQDWTTKLRAGATLESMASELMSSERYEQHYGGLNNEEFVTQLYRLALNREGEENGVAGWSALLDNGTSRSAVLAGFAESAEHVQLTTASWENGISLSLGDLSFGHDLLIL